MLRAKKSDGNDGENKKYNADYRYEIPDEMGRRHQFVIILCYADEPVRQRRRRVTGNFFYPLEAIKLVARPPRHHLARDFIHPGLFVQVQLQDEILLGVCDDDACLVYHISIAGLADFHLIDLIGEEGDFRHPENPDEFL